MNRYWDLAESKRAALTEEQVESYMAAELMERGVVRCAPPELLPIVDMPEPEVTLYVPKASYSKAPFGFRSVEDAAACMKTAVSIDSTYMEETTLYTMDKRKVELAETQVYSAETIAAIKPSIEKNKGALEENKRRTDAYNKAKKAVDEACTGVWDDYYGCLRKAREYKRIYDTLQEYVGICDGDESKAWKFLAKAFDADDILRMREWYDIRPIRPHPSDAAIAYEVEEEPCPA